jgi:hypothetical protein
VGGSSWRNVSARREGVLRVVAEDDTRSSHHAAQRASDHPYLVRQQSGGETCTDPQGGYLSGCRLSSGGSRPKSIGGSSWVNSELDENGKDTVVLDWFRPPKSKTLHPVWWDYAWKEISPRMEL